MASNRNVPVVRNPDEIDFLKTRQSVKPISRETAAALVSQLARTSNENDRAFAASVHEEGTTLNGLYAKQADAALGFKSFASMLRVHWKHGRSLAYERMLVAAFATAAECRTHGYTTVLAGCRLARALGLKKLGDLDGHVIGAGDTRVVVKFPAPPETLLAHLQLVYQPELLDPGTAGTSDLMKVRRTIDVLAAEKPAVKELKPVVGLVDGQVVVTVRARGPGQALTASWFYAQLARKRR